MYAEKMRLDLPLSRVLFGSYQPATVKHQISAVNVAEIGHRSIAHTAAKHSGFAFSKRGGPVLVMNNATTFNTVKHKPEIDSGSSDESSYSFTQNLHRRSPKRMTKKLKRTQSKVSRLQSIRSAEMSPLPAQQNWVTTMWSKQDIRELLHPGYPLDSMPKRPQTQTGAVTPSLSGGKTPVRLKYSPFSYCRHREFPSTKSSQTLRSTDAPYVEIAKTQLREERKSKEKWLAPNGFRTVFRPPSSADLRVTQSKPKTAHMRTLSGGVQIQ